MIFSVLATGPSMSQEVADSVNGRCSVVAVSDAYKLAPWADVLVSADGAWWRHHPDALDFEGKRYGLMPDYKRVEGVEKFDAPSGINSGLLGVLVAAKMGAKTILLLGFDMHGTHYFGPHPQPLKNTKPERFKAFLQQFEHHRPRGIRIVNCTPDSALKCFPFGRIEEFL